MAVEPIVIETARRYIEELNKKIPLQSAWVFGSRVRGDATEHSDLDIAVVSTEFDSNAFLARRAANRIFYEFESPFSIELHFFGVEDFVDDDEMTNEIKNTGIELTVN